MLGRVWRKGNPHATLLEMQIGAATTENSMGFPLKNLEIELPCNPAIPLLGIYPEENMVPQVFIAAMFTIAKTWKQPECL